jgi:Sulfotransferase family
VSAWHTFVDSDSWRRFAKHGPARPVFRSRAFRRALLERNRIIARRAARDAPDRFADARSFCFFVGHNRSGTSLLGGLLDAHSQIILADEADALKYVEAGFDRDELFHVLDRSSRTEARKGRITARRLEPYSYFVPGQAQGRSDHPRVVGDSTSGTSTRRLGEQPGLFDRLRDLGTEVKVIQVIRNPFDSITLMVVRSGRAFDDAIARYFAACRILAAVRVRLGAEELLPMRYEDVVGDPVTALRRACTFVGVESEAAFLDACASVVRARPERSRERLEWSHAHIADVEAHIADIDFLDGYSYAN